MINLHGFHFWNSKLWPLVLMLLCLTNSREKYFHSIFNSMGLSDLIWCYLKFKIKFVKRIFNLNPSFILFVSIDCVDFMPFLWCYPLGTKYMVSCFDYFDIYILHLKQRSNQEQNIVFVLDNLFTFFVVWGLLFIFTEA